MVDKERRREDQWVKCLKKDFNRTVAYLEKLYYELYDCESDAEMNALLEWIKTPHNEPEVESLDSDGVVVPPVQVQSWNDDPSEDDWDELEDDGVMVDPSYGWHRLNDPVETPALKTEDVLSEVALPIYQRIQSVLLLLTQSESSYVCPFDITFGMGCQTDKKLSKATKRACQVMHLLGTVGCFTDCGRKCLVGLTETFRMVVKPTKKWKDGKRNSFKQGDWDELWSAYKFRKDDGFGLRA